MRGPGAVAPVVDVEGVDSDERRPRRDEMLRRGAREEGMPRAVALGAPVDVPAGVYEHRFPLHVPPAEHACVERPAGALSCPNHDALEVGHGLEGIVVRDRKSTRLNSSHLVISYAVFCLKKKNKTHTK